MRLVEYSPIHVSAPWLQQKPQEAERNVIRQADMWLREYQSQDDLRHDSIVRLYGGDARFLSLYMEHVDARDLSARGVWRCPRSDNFIGDRTDATRILRDVASALHYLHSRRLVHNDIKPANILYSPARGAVLCDFGLSTMAGGPATNGGTPFYVPPEFIGARTREELGKGDEGDRGGRAGPDNECEKCNDERDRLMGLMGATGESRMRARSKSG
ncbi:hypothetical protein BN1723_010338 [Verticillium longisporum]|uniref:Protein kinase domain-containing protein n=1 Tax=Verticillium longisporum TaxID=100787 RepID=A0A0G4KYD8_VERLO|nr:hypothetical protein BN1723_010338 [Verticillium longisporum]